MRTGGISTRGLQAVVSNGKELRSAFTRNGRRGFQVAARFPFKLVELAEGRLARLDSSAGFSPPDP
jgi:hypothetical protein